MDEEERDKSLYNVAYCRTQILSWLRHNSIILNPVRGAVRDALSLRGVSNQGGWLVILFFFFPFSLFCSFLCLLSRRASLLMNKRRTSFSCFSRATRRPRSGTVTRLAQSPSGRELGELAGFFAYRFMELLRNERLLSWFR